MSSLAIVAWAILGRLGYETETISGLTLLEVTSLSGFKLTYGLGVFLASLALFLEPTSS